MKRYDITLMSMALLATLAVGCAKAPQDDISAADAEIGRARDAQADVWAPNEFQAADQAMAAARSEIETQNGKWIKNYDRTREMLARAKDEAGKAAAAAAANREQARVDADAALAEADAALVAAQAAHKVAPVSKDSKADLALYEGDLATHRQTLDAARQAFEAGDYKKALESAASVKARANQITTELNEARQKRMGARKS